MPPTTIAHADLDAFYASVEQRDDPSLRGRPVLVATSIVFAASYEARAFGVRSGMGRQRALAMCPGAVLVSPRIPHYLAQSEAVFDLFRAGGDLVEGASIDEAFLDVTARCRAPGDAERIGAGLRAAVRDGAGLPVTVGVAPTKFIAKIASRTAKPDGLIVVPHGEEHAFLDPLPIDRMWGVGPVTTAKLREHGARVIGDLTGLREADLMAIAGLAAGRRIFDLLHSRRPQPVRQARRRASFGAQFGAGSAVIPPDDVDSLLHSLVERVVWRMREAGRIGRIVELRLRYGDYTASTRARTLSRHTAEQAALLAVVRGLYREAAPDAEARGITLVGVGVRDLEDDSATQLELFELPAPPEPEPVRSGEMERRREAERKRLGMPDHIDLRKPADG
ncbi:DNA polymerase IV [Dactylosporangium sp. CS-047395]|uniref:DNA polymerase IV n=1 Tax=Dactylosporangium sp. CS-047395 TaxID=3239936 RepID=UPI003D90661F